MTVQTTMTISNRWDSFNNTSLSLSLYDPTSARFTLLWPGGISCRLMCPNHLPLSVTSTDPPVWRERATLHLNLTRLIENAGPWKAAFSGYMSTLGVDQPYANWHGWGWMANVDCNSGPWTNLPPRGLPHLQQAAADTRPEPPIYWYDWSPTVSKDSKVMLRI